MVAAGSRTICLPQLVRGVSITDKILHRPGRRFEDTYRFFETMINWPMRHPQVEAQLARVNGLHRQLGVAGNQSDAAREFFEYILFNLFVIPFQTLPFAGTDEEWHALYSLCALIADRMDHEIEGNVVEFEMFAIRYERLQMFPRDSSDPLRAKAVAIAARTERLLRRKSVVSPTLVRYFTPARVRRILRLDRGPIARLLALAS